jgi:hypothetical protein
MLEEYERLKVTTLNLWEGAPFALIGRFPAKPAHPTGSPFLKRSFLIL